MFFIFNLLYLALGHIEDVLNIDKIISHDGFFLPHHDVLRSGNRAPTLRVAFNGSQKTDVKVSLNDVLSKGSVSLCFVLENMLISSAGTSARYLRQIELNPEERLFQKIL
ncbi:hypothetical protein NPIL_75211 [Nephila pilipes]|uniref:Uncharacterized protein n=1 Tax=Nephila pilipes TaxID=299642 RepID=A0A8X6Q5I0_NEPPI|nr:hypothetical protein NPIL_75211 [Nephila pilipes]